MTKWKDHPDYVGYYQVSDNGRVRSVDRLVNCDYGQRVSHGKELTLGDRGDGRMIVAFWRDNKQKMMRVHRLVLETFIGPCPDGMECRHLDGDAANNNISNLAWGTRKENDADKVAHGTTARGEQQGASKLREWDVKWIRWFTDNGYASNRYLADVFGVCQAQISRIHTRQEWAWLT